MDAVILAAGRGSRLRGLVASGMKTLVVVEDEPLIVRLIRQATTAGAKRVVLVVSPSNCAAIADVVNANGHDVAYVVQPEPTGPADALRRGLEACETGDVLVLLGDNVLRDQDVHDVAEAPGELIVGVRGFTADDERLALLTRLRSDGTWVEKVPLLAEEETGIAWTGLFRALRNVMYDVLVRDQDDDDVRGERLLGPRLGDISKSPVLVDVDALDIGVRE